MKILPEEIKNIIIDQIDKGLYLNDIEEKNTYLLVLCQSKDYSKLENYLRKIVVHLVNLTWRSHPLEYNPKFDKYLSNYKNYIIECVTVNILYSMKYPSNPINKEIYKNTFKYIINFILDYLVSKLTAYAKLFGTAYEL